MRTRRFVAALVTVCLSGSVVVRSISFAEAPTPADGRRTAGAASATAEHAIRAQETFHNIEQALPTEPDARFHALGRAAKAAFDAGYYDEAQALAHELLNAAPHYFHDWYYGQAVATANIVLGRVVLKRDRNIAQAERYLKASEATLNTPFLRITGPNMSLAKDLLEAGDQAPVLQLLEESRKSWTNNGGQLDAWERTIKAGDVPNFGPNLLY
jgi:tetratricopeptide (TPR) repeat protein